MPFGLSPSIRSSHTLFHGRNGEGHFRIVTARKKQVGRGASRPAYDAVCKRFE